MAQEEIPLVYRIDRGFLNFGTIGLAQPWEGGPFTGPNPPLNSWEPKNSIAPQGTGCYETFSSHEDTRS